MMFVAWPGDFMPSAVQWGTSPAFAIRRSDAAGLPERILYSPHSVEATEVRSQVIPFNTCKVASVYDSVSVLSDDASTFYRVRPRQKAPTNVRRTPRTTYQPLREEIWYAQETACRRLSVHLRVGRTKCLVRSGTHGTFQILHFL